MKNIPHLAIIGGIAFLASSLQTANAAGRRIENVQPKVNLVGSPEIMASVRGSQPKKQRIAGPGEPAPIWLEFEADFDTADEFPELTMKCSVLLQLGKGVKLVEGEVTLVDVAKGKDRHAVMYIAPKTLNKLSENKPFTMTMVRAILVELSAQGELIGANFKGSPGITADAFTQGKDKLDKVTDAMLNKSQTPFGPLFWDYYEAIKPSSR